MDAHTLSDRSFNPSVAAQELCTQGITTIQSPVPKYFSVIAEGMEKLSRDPLRALFEIHHPRELDADGETDNGYYEREGGPKRNPRVDERTEGRTTYDVRKCIFHTKASTCSHLERQEADTTSYATMLQAMEKVRGEMTLVSLDIAEALDEILPGFRFASRMRAMEYWSPVRTLLYPCDSPDTDMLAVGHFDKCFLTAHIEASRKGYWYVNYAGVPQRMDGVGGDTITLFLGREAEKVTRGKLQPVFHGVIDEHGPKSLDARTSIVFFSRTQTTTDEETWYASHLKAKPNIAHERLRQLFVR